MGATLIRPNELAEFALSELGLAYNRLSPFADEFAAAEAMPSATGAAIAAGDRSGLESAAQDLAAPHVRITQRLCVPGEEPTAFTACLRRGPKGRVTVARMLADGHTEIHVLESVLAYLAAWLAVIARRNTVESNVLLQPTTLPELLLDLHVADKYRQLRQSRNNSPTRSEPAAIDLAEFFHSLAESAATRDPHCLLPALLLLTPGIGDTSLRPGLDNLRGLVGRSILALKPDSVRPGPEFDFGSAGKWLGETFLDGVSSAAGFEIAVWTAKGGRSWCRGFLVPSASGNHLFEIAPARGGEAVAEHHVLTHHQLMARLTALVTSALHPGAPTRAAQFYDLPTAGPAAQFAKPRFEAETKDLIPSAPQAVAVATRPSGRPALFVAASQRECPSCHAPAAIDAVFCARCGRSVAIDGVARCVQCRAQLATAAAFCTACGAPAGAEVATLAGQSPFRTQVPPSAANETLAIAVLATEEPSALSRCPNPRCGLTVDLSRKFCTECGCRLS